MPNKTVPGRKQSQAFFVPMRRPESNLCMMSVISGCNVTLKPNSKNSAERGRRGLCPTDYQTVYNEVREGIIAWKEVEDAGLCRPSSRDVSKKLLRTITAIRRAS